MGDWVCTWAAGRFSSGADAIAVAQEANLLAQKKLEPGSSVSNPNRDDQCHRDCSGQLQQQGPGELEPAVIRDASYAQDCHRYEARANCRTAMTFPDGRG